MFAIDYNEDHEPYAYFIPPLINREIKFLFSKKSINDLVDGELSYIGIDWPTNETAYTIEMKKRIEKAKIDYLI